MKSEKAYLVISVRFLSPFYYGNPRECTKFPPSPARLFQAMISASHMGGNRLVLEESAEVLKWFENLPPPTIISCGFGDASSFIRYVPRNDWDCSTLLKAWMKGKEPPPFGIHPSLLPLPKKSHLRKNHMDSQECFPTPLAGDPVVHYIWSLRNGGQDKVEKICRLVEGVVSLGWGTDFVIVEARILSEEEAGGLKGIRYVPDEKGEVKLDIPYPGFLERVIDRFEERAKSLREAGKKGWKRPPPLERRYQNYRNEHECVGPFRLWAGFSLIDPEEEDRRMAFPPQRWKEIVGWTRHAIAEAFQSLKSQEWINSCILGHNESASHPYFLPLPSIYSDGWIRRIMITWDYTLGIGEEEMKKRLNECPLKSIDGRVQAELRIDEDKYYERFLNPSLSWESVSPIILHGFDYRNGKFSLAKCHKLILEAFRNSGYPLENIQSLEFQKGPWVPGTFHVATYSVPHHLNNKPRYHIKVLFRTPVRGPLLVGIGRHYGLGLFVSSSSSPNL